mmetsp:Transcript_28804/g.68869  ORF Transcript_28804/g.68869 Transcript_28804/m.68869 type:complete len:279 (-) Transcript_28804:471-1307(-)
MVDQFLSRKICVNGRLAVIPQEIARIGVLLVAQSDPRLGDVALVEELAQLGVGRLVWDGDEVAAGGLAAAAGSGPVRPVLVELPADLIAIHVNPLVVAPQLARPVHERLRRAVVRHEATLGILSRIINATSTDLLVRALAGIVSSRRARVVADFERPIDGGVVVIVRQIARRTNPRDVGLRQEESIEGRVVVEGLARGHDALDYPAPRLCARRFEVHAVHSHAGRRDSERLVSSRQGPQVNRGDDLDRAEAVGNWPVLCEVGRLVVIRVNAVDLHHGR